MPIAAIGAGASLIGGLFSSHAASQAAKAQEEAARYAADKQYQLGQSSLDFNRQQYNDSVSRSKPWVQAGQGAISSLWDNLQHGDLSHGWTGKFEAPTAATEQNDPGYQFRLQEGQKALERSAASRGGVLGGGAVKAAQRYGQDYSSNEYNNVYNRALGQYQQSYNEFQNNQANEYNRLAGVAGIGQVSANNLNSAGSQAAGTNANISMNLGNQLGQDYMAAGNARASGYINNANAWNGAIGGIGSALSQGYMLNKLGGNGANPGSGGGWDFLKGQTYNLGGF